MQAFEQKVNLACQCTADERPPGFRLTHTLHEMTLNELQTHADFGPGYGTVPVSRLTIAR